MSDTERTVEQITSSTGILAMPVLNVSFRIKSRYKVCNNLYNMLCLFIIL
jgi:hypothetical protein